MLNCVYETVSQILRKNVEKRSVFENLDVVMLALDEICDGGVVLESDPSAVVGRVALRTDDIPLGEQTVAQVSRGGGHGGRHLYYVPSGASMWPAGNSFFCCIAIVHYVDALTSKQLGKSYLVQVK